MKFNKSRFPSPKTDRDSKDNTVLIRFDYSTFRKRVQFIGYTESKQLLELGLVSFKGIELSDLEFHNARWLKTKSLITRNKIIDEQLLEKLSILV